MMPNIAFKSILFPVDFSEACALTAPHVLRLAKQMGASVTLLHVIPWLSGWNGQSEIRWTVSGHAQMRDMETREAKDLQIFQQKFFPHFHCRLELRCGGVAGTITETAGSLGCDLIMMPTRGHGQGHEHPFLIGSTTAQVLHDARCAVWTSSRLKEPDEFAGIQHIICMVDQQDIPTGYVEAAGRLAAFFGAKLTFVSAVPARGPEHQDQDVAHLCDGLMITLLGSVDEVLRQITATVQTDLVLANHGHLQQPFGKFRTHAYQIIAESPCPVLNLCICSDQQDNDHAGSAQQAFNPVSTQEVSHAD